MAAVPNRTSAAPPAERNQCGLGLGEQRRWSHDDHGYCEHSPRPVNVNSFLKPYGFGYSTQWQNLSVLPLVQMLSLSAGELVNTSPIGNEVLAGVSELRVTFVQRSRAGTAARKTGLSANSSNFLLFAKKSGYPMGVATIVSPHTASSGRIIAWGDE